MDGILNLVEYGDAMMNGVKGGATAPSWFIPAFSAYAAVDSGPPQAVEDGGGASPDVYGLPCSATRHTAGRGRRLGSGRAGSLGVATPRPYSTRISPLLLLPSRALAARPITPSGARRRGVTRSAARPWGSARCGLGRFRWLLGELNNVGVPAVIHQCPYKLAGSSESPVSLWEPGRHPRNPDYLALPWLEIELFGSVRGVLSGPGCSGRLGRVGCLGYRVDSEQQDAMGVTSKGATVPVRAGDRRVVVSDGARLALLLGSRCSEHHTVRARACSGENGGGGRPNDLFSENVRL
ncbi:hypothetical protein TIFTF001_009761 [Ficus carica]|uniref:Uncharacterized protein n=1 Tax=Ficus carica TaxID=3494 RepID=A0AA87ZV83_FICCA|nr:hypothetical protein TIFTF001_009761 [Ficus carica]